MSEHRWHPCAICQESTQQALVGNCLLSRWDVQRLPAEAAPPVSWRCHHHRRCKLRPASTMWANEHGDLCCMLTCGHQVQWVFRGEWAYTPEMVQRGLATGELRLDKRRRCFTCGDLERAGQHPSQDEAVVSELEA